MAKSATAIRKSASKQKLAPKPELPAQNEITMIPLNKLELSPENVRTVKASDKQDAQLVASIKAFDVLQNLLVHKGPKGNYLVHAGGRRLEALQTLAKDAEITSDHPVPCRIEDKNFAIMASTTENTQRLAMHPADEYQAFDQMINDGHSEDEVALKFGVKVTQVRQRLKLARVAPEIFQAFKVGKINLECVMAFTLTDDRDRQMNVWNAVKENHYINDQFIRRTLTESTYSANSKLVKFIGVEAYKKAGGLVMLDMFSDGAATFLENTELVERLALEKLNEAAKDYVSDWKWVDAHLELDHGALRSFGRVTPEELPDDHELYQEQEALTAREAELSKIGDERDPTNEEVEEYDKIEARLEEIDDDIEAAKPFVEEDRKVSGVVITLDWKGRLSVTKGLVRPEDIPEVEEDNSAGTGDDQRVHVITPASSSPAPVADPAAAKRKAEGMPNSLAQDLTTARQHILRAHLSADFDVAFDAMLYTICKQKLEFRYAPGLPLKIAIENYYASNADKLLAGSVADKMLESIKDSLNLDWMQLEQPHDFKAMCELPMEQKQELFAFVVSIGVEAQLSTDNRPSSVIEEIGSRMDVDVAACWRPNIVNYWSSVTKAHIADVAQDIIGADFAQDRASEKKGEAAAAMELAFAENSIEASGLDRASAIKASRWLPKGMEFAEANRIDE